MKVIEDLHEIDAPGQYVYYLFQHRKTIVIEPDLDEGYCVCLDGWKFIMKGWNIRHWKKFENCRQFLLDAAVRGELGLSVWLKGRI